MSENIDNLIFSPINSKNHNQKEIFKFDEEEIKQNKDNDEYSEQREIVKNILNLINPSKKTICNFKKYNIHNKNIHNKIEQFRNELNVISKPTNNKLNNKILSIKIKSRNNNKNFYHNILYKTQKNLYRQKKLKSFFSDLLDKNNTNSKNIYKINTNINFLKTESKINTISNETNDFIHKNSRNYINIKKSVSLTSINTDFFLNIYKDSKIKNKYVRSLNKKINKLIDNKKIALNKIKNDINKIMNNNDNRLNNLPKKMHKSDTLTQKIIQQNKKYNTTNFEKYKTCETDFWFSRSNSIIKNKPLKAKKIELKFW